MIYDVAVVGGGPAGTAAAITAARAGYRVVVLERGRYPRHKVCGEFVYAEALELLASFLAADGESNTMVQNAPRTGCGRLFIDHRVLQAQIRPAAASIPRIDLDAALWRCCEKTGVDARQQVTVQSLAGDGPFTVTTSQGEFATRSVINASGRWSNLKRPPVNGTGKAARWIGLKAHFAELDPPASVDLYFFQHGYCGVQPIPARGLETQVTACAMVRADVASSLPDVFRQHPELERRSRRWKQVSETATTSPLLFSAPEPVRGRVLQSGDAAGFVDPFVGDGISLALRSGTLAAECLGGFLAGSSSLAEAVNQYQIKFAKEFSPVFRTSSKIRRLFSLPAPVRSGLLVLFQNAPGLTHYLVRKTR